jgi:hypothetical protein
MGTMLGPMTIRVARRQMVSDDERAGTWHWTQGRSRQPGSLTVSVNGNGSFHVDFRQVIDGEPAATTESDVPDERALDRALAIHAFMFESSRRRPPWERRSTAQRLIREYSSTNAGGASDEELKALDADAIFRIAQQSYETGMWISMLAATLDEVSGEEHHRLLIEARDAKAVGRALFRRWQRHHWDLQLSDRRALKAAQRTLEVVRDQLRAGTRDPRGDGALPGAPRPDPAPRGAHN